MSEIEHNIANKERLGETVRLDPYQESARGRSLRNEYMKNLLHYVKLLLVALLSSPYSTMICNVYYPFFAVIPMARGNKSQIVEEGDIFFFYRPKVGTEEVSDIEDVQRFYMVTTP
ncbi:MAG: hypothetical protein M3275_03785 [Thermoproteota archaeon]|nr:hypothetical protein [Thermoproteota archaeon]